MANGVIVHNCRCTAAPTYLVYDDPEAAMAQALRDAHGDPSKVLFGGSGDTPPGGARTDTADLRSRVNAAVDAMRDMHVTNRKGRRR